MYKVTSFYLIFHYYFIKSFIVYSSSKYSNFSKSHMTLQQFNIHNMVKKDIFTEYSAIPNLTPPKNEDQLFYTKM